MVNNTGLYPYSLEEARRQKEIKLWRESRKANADCCAVIEETISRDLNGKNLNPGCVQSVLAEFGYKRVNWVLATTLLVNGADGRYSPENMAWARRTPVRDLSWEKKPEIICVDVRPELLEQFVNQYREAVQALGLLDSTSCESDTGKLDFTGKVLVLSPDILKEECWRPEDQLWYAHDGFGCRPNAIGRSVRCTCLGGGEETRWNRHDFIGVLRDECLQDWARERLAELTGQTAPEIGGMTMN